MSNIRKKMQDTEADLVFKLSWAFRGNLFLVTFGCVLTKGTLPPAYVRI